MMFVSAPVVNERDEVVALLVLYLRSREFDKILTVARWGGTGETYAFDRAGLMITGSRFDQQLRDAGLLPKEPRSQGAALRIEIRDPGGNVVEGFRPSGNIGDLPLTKMAAAATT